MALSKDDKEFIALSLKPIVQKLETFEEINKKQDERLEKLESDSHETEKTFVSMDNWVETRGLTCPNNPRLEKVEKVQNDQKVTKKFVIKIFGWVAGGATFAVTAIKLVQHFF